MRTEANLESDAKLVERLRAGEEDAFGWIVAQHHQSLVRVAMLFVSDAGAAEEIAQDTWVAVLKGLPAFEGRSSLKTWIFRILVNRARTRGVRDKRMVPLADDAEGIDIASWFTAAGAWSQPPARWQAQTPEELLLRSETSAVLEAAIETLPDAQRAVITLRDVEGMSGDEVCNVLGLTETNQRVLLHRARTRVRSAVSAHLNS